MKKVYSKELIKEFKSTADKYPIIKYIKKKGAKNPFFLFKNVGEVWFESEPDYQYDDGVQNVYVTAFYDCAVFYKGKFHDGRKEKDFITKYNLHNDGAPEILIKNIIEDKKLVASKEYITPIRDLFRDIGLMFDNRKGSLNKDSIRQLRNDFFIKHYKSLGSPKRIPIKEILDKTEEYLSKKYPRYNRMLWVGK